MYLIIIRIRYFPHSHHIKQMMSFIDIFGVKQKQLKRMPNYRQNQTRNKKFTQDHERASREIDQKNFSSPVQPYYIL